MGRDELENISVIQYQEGVARQDDMLRSMRSSRGNNAGLRQQKECVYLGRRSES